MPAPVRRQLATVTGTLDALLSDPAHDALAGHFLSVTLTDARRVDDAMARLQRRFPHAVHLEWRPATAGLADPRSYRARVAGRGPVEIVREFVSHVRGVPVSPGEDALVLDAVEQQRRSGDEAVPALGDELLVPDGIVALAADDDALEEIA